jgi:subtilisin family serine protease
MTPSSDPELATEGRQPNPTRIGAVRGRVLDPTRSPVTGLPPAHPTAYIRDRLMIDKRRFDTLFPELEEVANEHGWTVTPNPESAKTRDLPFGVRTVTLSAPRHRRQPDAWQLLQYLRKSKGKAALRGIDLDHVVQTGAFTPAHWEIPHPQHWEIPHPDNASAVSPALSSYGAPGSGGRQPIAYAGRRPSRSEPTRSGRRPVVAILDTGCYANHPWFRDDRRLPAAEKDPVVRTGVRLRRSAIGFQGAATDPELHGDLIGPFDGEIDRIAGHGTVIAGLVHQTAPDATILSWRGIETVRPLVESEWLTTLAQITELVRLERAGDDENGHPIDVLSLSLGYYHENESDDLLDPILWDILEELGRLGVVVVCSAGNDSTGRPCYPAGFGPWEEGDGPYPASRDRAPLVAVGALNPNATDAMFTNGGPWVRAYAPGAAVMSTMPPFKGGLEPIGRITVGGRVRESIDPDDYRSGTRGRNAEGGFGLWSGTSFAAPVIAGRIAALIGDDVMRAAGPVRGRAGAAVTRAWEAVEKTTGIRRSEAPRR